MSEELLEGIVETVKTLTRASATGLYLFDDASVVLPFGSKRGTLSHGTELVLIGWQTGGRAPVPPAQISLPPAPSNDYREWLETLSDYFVSANGKRPLILPIATTEAFRGITVIYHDLSDEEASPLIPILSASLTEACAMLDLVTDRFLQRDLVELNEEGLGDLGSNPKRLLCKMLAKARLQLRCDGISFFAKDFTDDDPIFHLIATSPRDMPTVPVMYAPSDANVTSRVAASKKNCTLQYNGVERRNLLGMDAAKWRDVSDDHPTRSVMFTSITREGELLGLLRCTNKGSSVAGYFNAIDRRRADAAASLLMTWHFAAAKEARFTDSLNDLSHEIRTSATGVRSAATYIQKRINGGDLKADSQQVEYKVSFIIDTAETLINLLPALSSVPAATSSVGRSKPEESFRPYADLVKPLCESLRDQIRARKQSISITGEHQLGRIHASIEDFRHIFQNIIGNAVKYTLVGNDIMVNFERATSRNGFAKIHVVSESIPVRADEADDIFRSSYRGEAAIANRIQGTGLGLAIARAKARQYHGDVVFRRQERHNVFSLLIPGTLVNRME